MAGAGNRSHWDKGSDQTSRAPNSNIADIKAQLDRVQLETPILGTRYHSLQNSVRKSNSAANRKALQEADIQLQTALKHEASLRKQYLRLLRAQDKVERAAKIAERAAKIAAQARMQPSFGF